MKYQTDCDSLDGAELEDGGGAGTVGSHWENRLFDGDVMNGQISDYMTVTPLTLTYLLIRAGIKFEVMASIHLYMIMLSLFALATTKGVTLRSISATPMTLR